MISAILGMFDVKRVRIRCPPRADFTDEFISRGRHESHDRRGVQDRKDGDDSGAHGGNYFWCVRRGLECHQGWGEINWYF